MLMPLIGGPDDRNSAFTCSVLIYLIVSFFFNELLVFLRYRAILFEGDYRLFSSYKFYFYSSAYLVLLILSKCTSKAIANALVALVS